MEAGPNGPSIHTRYPRPGSIRSRRRPRRLSQRGRLNNKPPWHANDWLQCRHLPHRGMLARMPFLTRQGLFFKLTVFYTCNGPLPQFGLLMVETKCALWGCDLGQLLDEHLIYVRSPLMDIFRPGVKENSHTCHHLWYQCGQGFGITVVIWTLLYI